MTEATMDTSSQPPNADDSERTGAAPSTAPQEWEPVLDLSAHPLVQQMESWCAAYEQQMDGLVPPRTDAADSAPNSSTPWGHAVAPNETHPMLLRRRGPVCVQDHDGQVLAYESYMVVVNDSATTDSTDEQGWIAWVDMQGSNVLQLFVRDNAYQLTFGDGPSENVTPAQSILNALGFSAGPLDGNAGPRTQAAVSCYQVSRGLSVTGQVDNAMIAKLKEEHLGDP